jgi:hypothetical protein
MVAVADGGVGAGVIRRLAPQRNKKRHRKPAQSRMLRGTGLVNRDGQRSAGEAAPRQADVGHEPVAPAQPSP